MRISGLSLNMNIILFTNKRGQVWNYDINLLHASLTVVFGLIALLAAAVYTGVRLGNDELKYVADWQDVVSGQQAEIAEARQSAQADIDALTLRIGQLQAQMLRLNALGGRLVSQSDLDKGEFDFDAVPAVGGPENVIEQAIRATGRFSLDAGAVRDGNGGPGAKTLGAGIAVDKQESQ